jgi:hypothetical protein
VARPWLSFLGAQRHRERGEQTMKSSMSYRVGQWVVTRQGVVLRISQVYEDTGGLQIALQNEAGIDYCRATEAEVRVSCEELAL